MVLLYFNIIILNYLFKKRLSDIEEINNIISLTDIALYTQVIFQNLFGTGSRSYVVLYRMKCGASERWIRSVGPIM
jgi:hypothetical protein